jgi:uncharacterized protein
MIGPSEGKARAARRPTASPVFSTLDDEDARSLLRRNRVGRIAFSFHDRVDVEPVHYVFDEQWLFGRTSPGSKLSVVRHNPWVAFEVDEPSDTFDWQSVVVHGTVYVLEPDGPPSTTHAWARAMELLQEVVPGSGTADDPVPHRTVVFGIHVDEIIGRAATTAAR